jgi:hypothetical protein
LERKDYKQVLLVGLFFIVIGFGVSPSVSPVYSPEAVVIGAMIVSIGILFDIVAIGSLLVKQDMDQRASLLHIYGLLLIGAGPAFLILSQIARYGIGYYSWRSGTTLIYFRTSNWWIFFLAGVVFIFMGAFLALWSWRYRRSVDASPERFL